MIGTIRMRASSWALRMARPTASVGSFEAQQVAQRFRGADRPGFAFPRAKRLEDFHTHNWQLRSALPAPLMH